MNDRMRKIIISALIIIFTAGVFKMMTSGESAPVMNEEEEEIRLVEVQKVQLIEDTSTVKVYGHVKSYDEIDLFPEVNGVITNSNFREGQEFSKGDVLVLIDHLEFENGIKSARSNFLSLISGVIADIKFDYEQELPAWESYLSSIDFNKTIPELPVTDNVKLKKYLSGKGVYNTFFSIKSQEDRLSKYQLVAPFDGVLTEVTVKPGTSVRPGQKLAKFVSTSLFELEASISLKESMSVKSGAIVNLESSDMGKSWDGIVSRVGKTIDQQSQSVKVYISVNSKDLLSGTYLEGKILSNPLSDVYRIKRSLIEGDVIYVVSDNILKKQKVQVISVEGDYALIKGLKDGQLILKNVVHGAHEGMKVRFE